LLGLGGICTAADAVEFFLAGATAVAVGTASFVEPDRAARIVAGLADYCARHDVTRVSDLVGALRATRPGHAGGQHDDLSLNA
jgi:dihydroorotate dehydrogenase (NAD+) catalytic subunit